MGISTTSSIAIRFYCSLAMSNNIHICKTIYIPYHTMPYGIMLTISPYTPQKPYIWDRSGNLYQFLHVLQLQTSSFSRCVCVSCKKHVGILYLSVTFGKLQDSIIGSLVFLEPWCVLLLGCGSSKTVPKRSQTTPNYAETARRETN